jgi:multidrug efflux pump subunit AcrB
LGWARQPRQDFIAPAKGFDRTRAQQAGLSARDIANSLVVNLSGSGQVAPTWWLNPDTGISYPMVMQTPQYRLDSLDALGNLSVSGGGSATPQTLGALASFRRSQANAVLTQIDNQTVVQIKASVQGRDLGAVASDIRAILEQTDAQLPKGARVELAGQASTMDSAFSGLLYGLLGAIVLIYLVVVVSLVILLILGRVLTARLQIFMGDKRRVMATEKPMILILTPILLQIRQLLVLILLRVVFFLFSEMSKHNAK